MEEVLTPLEKKALDQAAELWNTLTNVVGLGPSRQGDLRELQAHIHGIQRAIMCNAAARAYPGQYRLLGNVVGVSDSYYATEANRME